MGGKFFDSSWKESAVKNKRARQGGIDDPDPPKRNKRKKKKHIRLQYLQPRHPWWNRGEKADGCWVLLPCEKLTDGFQWGWTTRYEKVRDAKNAIRQDTWFDYVAWRILDKDGNVVEGGLKDLGET